jgi:lysine biosynthesis protein LysW
VTGTKAICPNCGHEINLEQNVKERDWIACPHCQAADIEVVSLDPPLLDWAYEGPEIAGYPRYWASGTEWRRWCA